MKLIIDIPEEGFNACKLWVEMGAASWQDKVITNGIPYEKECIIEELAKSKNEERPKGELKQLQEVKNICEHWNDKSSSFVSACEAFEKILDVMKGGVE